MYHMSILYVYHMHIICIKDVGNTVSHKSGSLMSESPLMTHSTSLCTVHANFKKNTLRTYKDKYC